MKKLLLPFLALAAHSMAPAAPNSTPAEPFPLSVTSVQWNVPAGVGYDPQALVEVTMNLKNTTAAPLPLSQGLWRVRRTRALVADPGSIWEALYTDEIRFRGELPVTLPAVALG